MSVMISYVFSWFIIMFWDSDWVVIAFLVSVFTLEFGFSRSSLLQSRLVDTFCFLVSKLQREYQTKPSGVACSSVCYGTVVEREACSARVDVSCLLGQLFN